MPHLSISRAPEGWILPLTVGVKGATTALLAAAGQPIPPPQLIRGLIDTGTDVTGISPAVLARLQLGPIRHHSTQALSGQVAVRLYEISLTIPGTGPPARPLMVLDRL